MKDLHGPEYPPLSGDQPEKLICFLHGYGSDGFDLFGLTKFLLDLSPNVGFISPNAPFDCESSNFGYQWFSLEDRMQEKLFAEAEIAVEYLDRYLSRQLKKYQLGFEDCFLVGFSQGTMLALHYLLHYRPNLRGVLGYSGMLIDYRSKEESKTPICLIHGKMDDVVPLESMKNSEKILKQNNINIETYTCSNLGHSINDKGLELGKQFIEKHLYG